MTYKQIIDKYFEIAWNQGKLDILDEIIDPKYVNHNPGFENPEPGPKGLKPIIQEMRKCMPDLHFKILDMVISEGRVAIYSEMSGTHSGLLFGMKPTGKKVSIKQMQIERIANGKIVEHWRVTDDLTMLKQLGMIEN